MRHLTSEDFQSTPNLRFLQLKEIKSNAHINFHYLHRLQRLDVNKAQSYNFLDRLPADLHMLKLYSSDSNESATKQSRKDRYIKIGESKMA